MAKVGRKIKITPEIWRETALEIHSINDQLIANKLRISRQTVNRMRLKIENNEELKEKFYDPVIEYLTDISDTGNKESFTNFELFKEIRIIKKWKDDLRKRLVSKDRQNRVIRSMFNLCNYLNIHPSKITLDQACDFVIEQKIKYYNSEPQIKGLYYSAIRETVRDFFMTNRGVSAIVLRSRGVTKEQLKGAGKFAKQKVEEEVRHKLEKTLMDLITDYNTYLEALYACKFMFYGAGRVSATLEFNFDTHEYVLDKNVWVITIIDKGVRGGKDREKILIEYALDDMRNYINKRFGIEYKNMEKEIPEKINYLFPSFVKENGEANDNKLRGYIKPALIKAGLRYKEFHPCHIWRHTFAQVLLPAVDWNYELVASLGGWDNSGILKKHYGEMGRDPRIRGLRRGMGFKVEIETKPLKW